MSSDAWCLGSCGDHGGGVAGLSQVRIAHLIGHSPSVMCHEIAHHTDPDGEFRSEEAGKAAHAARRHPKKRLLELRWDASPPRDC